MSDPAPASSPPSNHARESARLPRVLGLGMAIAMVVGNVIGAGIFLKPGDVAAAAGSFPVIAAAWIVGGLVCVLGALCFAELAVMKPEAGGMYVYLREAYGRPVAFLFGWSEFVFGRPASTGALAAGIVIQLDGMTKWRLDESIFLEVGIAIAIISFLTVVNIAGAIWGGRTQVATTLIKAGFLGVLAALPFVLTAFGTPSVSASNYATTIEPAETTFVTQFAVALLAIMWAYNGWHGVTPIAEEIRNPQRNIPLALFGGLGILIVLYLSANLAYHGVLSMSEVAEAGVRLPQVMIARTLESYGESAVEWGVTLFSLVIMCSMFGATNSNMLNGPRITFAMGRDDVFFRSLGAVHAAYRTPAFAIFIQAVMSIVLVIASALLVRHVHTFRDSNIFQILTDYVVFIASIFYMLTVGAVVVLRVRHPDWDRPYRIPAFRLITGTYMILNAIFLVALYGDPQTRYEANIGIALSALGLPVYYGWQRWGRQRPLN